MTNKGDDPSRRNIFEGITDGGNVYIRSVKIPEHVFQAEGHQLPRAGSRKRYSSQMALYYGRGRVPPSEGVSGAREG